MALDRVADLLPNVCVAERVFDVVTEAVELHAAARDPIDSRNRLKCFENCFDQDPSSFAFSNSGKSRRLSGSTLYIEELTEAEIEKRLMDRDARGGSKPSSATSLPRRRRLFVARLDRQRRDVKVVDALQRLHIGDLHLDDLAQPHPREQAR